MGNRTRACEDLRKVPPRGPQWVKGPLGHLSSWLGLSVILLSMIFMSSPLFMTLGCHHWPKPRENTASYALISHNTSAYLAGRKCFPGRNGHMWVWRAAGWNALPGIPWITSLKSWRTSSLKEERGSCQGTSFSITTKLFKWKATVQELSRTNSMEQHPNCCWLFCPTVKGNHKGFFFLTWWEDLCNHTGQMRSNPDIVLPLKQ